MFRFRSLPLILALLAPVFVLAAEPLKVAYQVVCDDRVASEKLSAAVDSNFKKFGLEVADRLPRMKLFIYAQQDVNDRVNVNGWSFAIAHVSNAPTYFVAAKLISSEAQGVSDVRPTLLSMVKEEGFLTYMNVAHADRLNPENISQIVQSAVSAFAERVK